MSFVWPPMLVVLLAVPAFVAGYLANERRRGARRKNAAASALVSTNEQTETGRRRHLPFALFMVALTLLLAGFARPELTIGFPRIEGTVIVAVDSSTSMVADDVLPSRLDVAKQGAAEFVEQRPSDMTVGLVSFTNGAVVTQAPTKNTADLLAAIDRIQPEGLTSVGQGVFTALGAIIGDPIPVDTSGGDADLASLDIGFHSSAVVLVFSDGENTTDFDPLEVAKLAANAGVKIFTVGVGTEGGAAIEIDGFTVASRMEEQSLRDMADISDGQFFATVDGVDIDAVYDAIDTELRVDAERSEVTALIAGVAIVFLLAACGLSLRWFGRVA